ncbi:MAG: hypothetical protein HC769_07410 [Cyanobacteria bacterium CRU_2_1]|nr:hypothetical protein [Cyanobacteria bacterium CRU_2_1]
MSAKFLESLTGTYPLTPTKNVESDSNSPNTCGADFSSRTILVRRQYLYFYSFYLPWQGAGKD